MTRTVLPVLATASLFLGAAFLAGAASRDEEAGRLPGARVVIDAAKHGSIQEALDAVPEGGGLVRIPPGEFIVGEPLVLRRGETTIRGAGPATRIRNVNEDGEPALILEHPEGATSREHELWRIRVAGLRITGNEKSGPGIEARRINEVHIQGVSISECGAAGIRLLHCYEDPRIRDALVTYNDGPGIDLVGCHDIVVSSNQLEENVEGVRCVDGFNLCMSGNCLDDHLGDGVVIENTYGSVLSGNMIEECQGAAVVLRRDCYGITVSANVIAHEQGGGVLLEDAHGSAVSANTFTIVGGPGVWVGPDSDRIAVTGNAFSDSWIGSNRWKRGEDDRQAGGLVLRATRDVAAAGNLFSGVRPRALELEGERSRRVLFAGNLLTDAPSEHRRLTESEVSGNLESGPVRTE